ncbi:MAG: ThiF family adenylyltransferase [Desulfurococcales archaeon]|nr:ThiF family adenylyltransferase [Desulfurococcales archaeon]
MPSSLNGERRTVTIMVNGMPLLKNVSIETPLDLKALIARTAQENGMGRFDVYINDTRVSPGDIDKMFMNNRSLKVNIIPADVAASTWIRETYCDPNEIEKLVRPESFFLRQKNLPLRKIDSVAVAGLGGIGSWIAYFLAISRQIGFLELIDFDYIEPHNLNRTPYNIKQVCFLKARAIADIIRASNKEIGFQTYEYPLETVIHDLRSDILIEATDSLKLRPYLKEWLRSGKRLITVHYDGESITIGVNLVPGEWSISNESPGYTTAPVYVATPAVAAALVVHILLWISEENFLEKKFLYKTTLSRLVKSASLEEV